MKQSTWRQGLFTGVALVTLTLAIGVPASAAGAASSRPTAPRSVHARARNASAYVRWIRPTSSGTSAIKGYVVTAHPSSRTCRTASRSCVVKGLKGGSRYSFTVVAKNSSGASPRSRSSNKVTIALSNGLARAAFLTANAKLQSSLTIDITAINAWTSTTTAAQQTADLTNLQNTFKTFTGTLRKDKWPSAAKAHIAAYISEVNAFGTDYVALFGATSASNAALRVDTFQSDGNKELVGETLVRADLRLPQLISGPVASTSTPVAIGAAQIVHDFYGDTLSATVSQVVDPATAGANSGLPDAGYRFVAVELNLSNTGPSNGEVDSNANLGLTVVGSDGQTYSADFGTVSQCTNFTFGEFQLPTGDTATGCVVFQLPTAVTVASVRFSLDAGYLDTVVWTA